MTDVIDILDKRKEKEKKRRERASSKKPKRAKKKLTKKEQQILEVANNTVLPDYYKTIWVEDELEELCGWLRRQNAVAIDTETMGTNPFIHEIVGISFYAPHQGFYIPLKHQDDIRYKENQDDSLSKIVGVDYVRCLDKKLVADKLRPILEDCSKKYIFHNGKFDKHILKNWMGIDVKVFFDTMIAQALLDENQSKALKDMATLYLKIPADKYSTLFGKVTFDKVPILLNPETRTGNIASYYAIKDTELTFKLARFQAKAFEREKLKPIKKLFYEVEMPFLEVVAGAEQRGVQLDKEYLENTVAKQLHNEVEELKQKIWKYTGEINLNSPAQLSQVLYNKLKYPKANDKKSDSTDKKTLEKLKRKFKKEGKSTELIDSLLDYRAKVKLTTAFADKLPKAIINGRVHTSFNQVGAKTGRMSSSDPNLQQIPSRIGNLIRNAFVADEGRLLVSIDFSQQELRVLAHVSQDPVLLDVYKSGKDVHSMTAVSIYNMENPDAKVSYDYFQYCRNVSDLFRDKDGNLDEDKLQDIEYICELYEKGEVNTKDSEKIREQVEQGEKFEKARKSAKTINFGIVYGMSEQGLAESLGITEEEAKQYIGAYFAQYPGVRKWMAEQKKKMRKVKYTETMLGRKRRVYPEMDSGKFWLEQSAYRMGINAVIQGSSADMVKLASIKLQPLLKELDAYIVLWVHDK